MENTCFPSVYIGPRDEVLAFLGPIGSTKMHRRYEHLPHCGPYTGTAPRAGTRRPSSSGTENYNVSWENTK
jgi:hypothetical protein